MPITTHHGAGGFGGALYTRVNIENKWNAKKYRGLPNFVVAGAFGRIAIATIDGILTTETSLPAVTSSNLVSATVSGAGVGVSGVLTRLSLSGRKGDVVTFSAEVAGTTQSASTSSVSGTLIFCDEISVSGISGALLEFSLDLSWDIEFIYTNKTGYPDLDESFLKGFEGTLTAKGNGSVALGTFQPVSWSISAGQSFSISGTGYIEAVIPSDSVDDIYGTTVRIMISSI